MSRLTLRLPDSLHQQLEQMAENEQISLNQYIVYALTRQLTLAYNVQAVSEKVVAEERAAYSALLQTLGRASFDEIQQALAARETVEPEAGLTPEVIENLRAKIAARKNKNFKKKSQRPESHPDFPAFNFKPLAFLLFWRV